MQLISAENLQPLKAALLDGDEALVAYQAWRDTLDLATLPYGQQRLLPVLQRNLTRLGIDDPLIDRFRGIRRYFWVRNLTLLSFARGVFDALDRGSVPFIVLKGAALIACYLQDHSLRPMDDIDILVPEDRLPDAVGILAGINLLPVAMSPRQLLESKRVRSSLPGWPFRVGRQNIDVHWKALHFDLRADADDEFWRFRCKTSLHGTRIHVLDPAHQLLHIFAHAAQPTAGAALQCWPADATWVIRGSADLSFERLVSEAMRRELSAITSESLMLLADEFHLPIPKSAISSLKSCSSWTERMEVRLLAGRPGVRGTLPSLLLAVQEFRRGKARGLGIVRTSSSFLKSWTGTPKTSLAILVAGQFAFGRPALLRRLLGRDRHRSLPDLDRLPTVGDTLDLAGTEIDETPLVAGWSFPEPNGRWTLGHEATVAWRLQDHHQDVTLLIDASPAVKKPRSQSIRLLANDRCIASLRVYKKRPLKWQILVPKDAIQDCDVLFLTFLISRPVCPAENGQSMDTRALGLHVRSIALRAGRLSDSTTNHSSGGTRNVSDREIAVSMAHPDLSQKFV